MVRHFEAAQQAFRNFDLPGALEHLDRVQAFAPNLAGAKNGIAKIRQRQADIARVQLAYETARAGGRLVSRGGRSKPGAGWSTRNRSSSRRPCPRSSRVLRRAESLAARARNLERTDPAAARDLYRQSLAIAADLPDALTGLKRTPPDPPAALDGQVLGDRIRLSWTPPPPDGLGPLTFVVVRKRGGALEHPGDGTRIAEVSTSEFDDMHVTPGDTVGYAVLSKRGGVESVSAISLGPFVFLADVKDVRVEVHNHEVELAWTLPRGVSEVRVIRKQGGPPKSPATATAFPPRSTMRWTGTSIPMRFTTTGSTPSTRCRTAGCFLRRGSWSRRGRSRRSRRSRLLGCCWNQAASPHRLDRAARAARSRSCARLSPCPSPPALG